MFPGPGQPTSFEEWLRGLVHNIGHFMVGGTMMTLFSSGDKIMWHYARCRLVMSSQ